MMSPTQKFEIFRRVMNARGYSVAGGYDAFTLVMEALPGTGMTLKISADANGIVYQEGEGPSRLARPETAGDYVEMIIRTIFAEGASSLT